jgi:hypothetical protein
MPEIKIINFQNVSPLPWTYEERYGHSGDGLYRYVIVDANGDRVAIISLNGAPHGDKEIAENNVFRLVRGANFVWENG